MGGVRAQREMGEHVYGGKHFKEDTPLGREGGPAAVGPCAGRGGSPGQGGVCRCAHHGGQEGWVQPHQDGCDGIRGEWGSAESLEEYGCHFLR